VSVEDLRELLARRKAEDMRGVWLPIAEVESMLVEVELYRAKHDPATRRQRDAARAARGRVPPKPDD